MAAERVTVTVELLEGGATVAFIARYRRDATGDLDEAKIEAIARGRAAYLALADRRTSALDTLAKQGRLTEDLRREIEECRDKGALEEFLSPLRKKRRTKATVAREKGLVPLADYLWAQIPSEGGIREFAATFVKPEKALASIEEALDGAHHILAERLAADSEVRTLVRRAMLREGKITAHATKNAEGKKTKFEAYYGFSEPAEKIPSHRFLAILRGVNEGLLRMELAIDDASIVAALATAYLKSDSAEFEPYVRAIIEDSYQRLLRPAIESEVMASVHQRADEEAVHVFRANAESLLMAPPAGRVSVMGVAGEARSGYRLAVVDPAGTCVETGTLFSDAPEAENEESERLLLALIEKHSVAGVAVSNSAGAREVGRFVKRALGKQSGREPFLAFVNEAGATLYAASKAAREELPDLDVLTRCAVSTARRLQDPLAELVKTEPRHIGVGQYQHDVNQRLLREGLHDTVASCVNRVGADLNTASLDLLRYVSGLQKDVAKRIVEFRAKNGKFTSRAQLLEIEGVTNAVFQQAAGFLRVIGGEQPLDATAIHPEAYELVGRMAQGAGVADVPALLEAPQAIRALELAAFCTDVFGPLALRDIRDELLRAGRDPRGIFRAPKFLEGVNSVRDLEEGMELEGAVTNVTDFGAFVDVGVHQDGLVHLSELANRFIADPRQVVKVGDVVRVKVIKVDKEQPRISLSMKALLPPPVRRPGPGRRPDGAQRPRRGGEAPAQGAGAPDGAQPEAGAQQEHGGPRAERDTSRRFAGRGRAPEGERRPPARPDGASRRDQGERASADRPPREGQGRPDRPQRERRERRPADRPRSFGHGSGEPINTLLADQLAALREKLQR